jgi:hypothetical protein
VRDGTCKKPWKYLRSQQANGAIICCVMFPISSRVHCTNKQQKPETTTFLSTIPLLEMVFPAHDNEFLKVHIAVFPAIWV